MIIRQENSEDYLEIYELVKKSFSTVSDGEVTEHEYLNELRKKKDKFIPELSLVAENENKKIVGQIVLSKTRINTGNKEITTLLLSPICVDPEYFRQGIARSMMNEAFKIALEMNYSAVFLCGDPNIYRKLGFRPTHEYGIYHINDKSKNAEWCMARELVNGALSNISGTIDIV